jgi:aldehyde:ferredoxin oxidoreductase
VHGFCGRLLHVDLGSGRSTYHDLDEPELRACLGGIGLGASLLHTFAPPRVDPLGPDNPLIFTSAPLVGTGLTTTAKFAVVTKSPLTNFIADSLSSSGFALELKRLGIDALAITGAAPALVYLAVDGDRVDIRDARTLAGKSPRDTESFVRDDLRCAASVASIGMAGERRVRFATISNDGRHAGRGGVGAVMGSKNLKAIAIRGEDSTSVADPRGVNALVLDLRRRSLGPQTAKYRRIGTVANLAVFNRLGTLPTRNFQQATFEDAGALTGESLTESHFSRRHGCASCSIQCERLFRIAGSESTTAAEQRLEYETLFALGPLCGVSDPEYVLEAARLCDAYGLDTISTGGTLAWAIEAGAKGLVPAAAAIGLQFGDGGALVAAIHAIARREGIGDLLAEGSKRAAAAVGCGAGGWAMHVKGLELPGYDPRSLKTMALGLAVSPRGACHNRSGAYEADFSGEVDRFHGDAARGAMVAGSEDFAAVLDSLIICKFLRKCFHDFYPEAAEILSRVTGWDCTGTELRRAGERIHTLKKQFNVREGWQPGDDWLPGRLLDEPLTTGAARGAGLSGAELREMIRGYYAARGWDENGFVPARKLDELGIDPRLVRPDHPNRVSSQPTVSTIARTTTAMGSPVSTITTGRSSATPTAPASDTIP